MTRSILAVLAGFATWTACWLTSNQILFRLFRSSYDDSMMTSDSWLLGLVLLLSVLFSVIAGWTTAAVARRKEVAHGFALGVVQLAVGIAVQTQVWSQMPLWYHLGFLALLLPGNVVGALLRRDR